MFRSSIVGWSILIVLLISMTYGKSLTIRKRQISSTRKPTSIKMCGAALVRMLDMVCDRARQLLNKEQEALSVHEKRQMPNDDDDDPFARTLWVKDYAQFNNTLIGDCCLQACTLKTLLKYC